MAQLAYVGAYSKPIREGRDRNRIWARTLKEWGLAPARV